MKDWQFLLLFGFVGGAFVYAYQLDGKYDDKLSTLTVTVNGIYTHQVLIADRMAQRGQLDAIVDLISELHPEEDKQISRGRKAVRRAGPPIPALSTLARPPGSASLYGKPLGYLAEWREPSDDVVGAYALNVGEDGRTESAVRAMRFGEISSIAKDEFWDDRVAVRITHNFGAVTYYGAIIKREDLEEGDVVEQGEQIGVAIPGSKKWLRIGLIDAGKFVDPTGILPQMARKVFATSRDGLD